jgi:threonine dehydrogenase-like Zn-dependent dehydrogenase
MKTIVKYAEKPGTLGLRDMPKPEPGHGEAVVQVKATGICYTDISILENKYKGRKPVPIPVILGHEGAGIVAEVGEGVENVSVGDRVGLEALFGCGRCYDCLNGNKNMCTDWGHIGITCHGTFAEYTLVPAALAYRLPDNVSFTDAAFLEPIALTVRTLEHVKPMVGDTAAIIGPGSLGMFHLQALKAAGAAKIVVIGLEQDRKRFQIAETLGADHVINASEEDVVQRVRELTDGLGVDIVVETANSPAATRMAIEIAGSRGRVALFGLYPEATISPLALLRSGLSVFGDVGTVQRQFLRAIRWVAHEKVLAEPLITRRFSLEEFEEAFESVREGETVKVLFAI